MSSKYTQCFVILLLVSACSSEQSDNSISKQSDNSVNTKKPKEQVDFETNLGSYDDVKFGLRFNCKLEGPNEIMCISGNIIYAVEFESDIRKLSPSEVGETITLFGIVQSSRPNKDNIEVVRVISVCFVIDPNCKEKEKIFRKLSVNYVDIDTLEKYNSASIIQLNKFYAEPGAQKLSFPLKDANGVGLGYVVAPCIPEQDLSYEKIYKCLIQSEDLDTWYFFASDGKLVRILPSPTARVSNTTKEQEFHRITNQYGKPSSEYIIPWSNADPRDLQWYSWYAVYGNAHTENLNSGRAFYGIDGLNPNGIGLRVSMYGCTTDPNYFGCINHTGEFNKAEIGIDFVDAPAFISAINESNHLKAIRDAKDEKKMQKEK